MPHMGYVERLQGGKEIPCGQEKDVLRREKPYRGEKLKSEGPKTLPSDPEIYKACL